MHDTTGNSLPPLEWAEWAAVLSVIRDRATRHRDALAAEGFDPAEQFDSFLAYVLASVEQAVREGW